MVAVTAIKGRTHSAPEGARGFTLIEALVSLLILSVLLLGLHAGMMTAITMNMENLLRNEAVDLAQEHMDRYRITPGSPPNTETATRQVRNNQITYRVNNVYDGSTNVLDMTIQWNFKNEQYSLQYTSHIGG